MQTDRRIIRTKAFQVLFQLEANPDLAQVDAIDYALTYPVPNMDETLAPLDAMTLNLQKDESEANIVQDALAYFEELVVGVTEHQAELDELIESKLTNWSIKRLESPTLTILRLAAYELNYQDIDPRIVLNEAIELTKTFNNEEASKFVNGVLQGILDAKEA